jgi:branched-chain amino acid transport system permease protein
MMSRADSVIQAAPGAPRRRAAWWEFRYRNELIALAVLVGIVLVAGDSLPLGIASIGVVGGFSVLLHAIAIILVYRTDRFINFAQIQIGLVGAALFTSLVQGGAFFRLADTLCGGCVGPAPSRTLVAANFVVAVVLGLAVSVLVALICYFLVVQRFAHHSRLILTIAMIFVAQLLMTVQHQVGMWLTTEDQRDLEGINPHAPSPPPWEVNVDLDPARLRLDGTLTIVVGLSAVAGIAAYLRFSSTGVALRAVSENPPRARTLGISTIGVTARVWVLVGLLSGAAGILNAFSQGSGGGSAGDIVVLPVRMLVLVLAVAVIARFSSLVMAAVAAVVFGVLQEAAVWSFDSSAPVDAALVLVIGAVLLMHRSQGGRADDDGGTGGGWQAIREVRPVPRELKSVPAVRAWTRAGGVLLAVVVLALPWLLSPSQTTTASTASDNTKTRTTPGCLQACARRRLGGRACCDGGSSACRAVLPILGT